MTSQVHARVCVCSRTLLGSEDVLLAKSSCRQSFTTMCTLSRKARINYALGLLEVAILPALPKPCQCVCLSHGEGPHLCVQEPIRGSPALDHVAHKMAIILAKRQVCLYSS